MIPVCKGKFRQPRFYSNARGVRFFKPRNVLWNYGIRSSQAKNAGKVIASRVKL